MTLDADRELREEIEEFLCEQFGDPDGNNNIGTVTTLMALIQSHTETKAKEALAQTIAKYDETTARVVMDLCKDRLNLLTEEQNG